MKTYKSSLNAFSQSKVRVLSRSLLCLAVLIAISYPIAILQSQAQSTAAAPPVTDAANSTGPKQQTDPNLAKKSELAADTAKLLVLANELKVEMDKSDKDMLSLSVMRKADEIERLARKVRIEMRTSLGN